MAGVVGAGGDDDVVVVVGVAGVGGGDTTGVGLAGNGLLIAFSLAFISSLLIAGITTVADGATGGGVSGNGC